MTSGRPLIFTRVLVVAVAVAASLFAGSAGAAGGNNRKLVGTFEIEAGACDAGGNATGSYFKMVQLGGTAEHGPFIGNPDSTCADQEFTPLESGTDGGLITGKYQPQPDPPFDAAGNGLADRIHAPASFLGVEFGSSTNRTDPETGTTVPKVKIRVKGSKLSGNITAYSVAHDNQVFNQGAPKPDGALPGLTQKLTGTYDADTREFELDWVSQFINDFTGVWHFEGTFDPAKQRSK
jgi:hypothetical protein